MLIDLHCHSSEFSVCCKASGDDVLAEAERIGLDGIVLTNHYQKNYLKEETPQQLAERYVRVYRELKQKGEARGLRVFFGVEVTMDTCNHVHMLVYGVDESFILQHPTVYDYTQQELYRAAHEAGGILVQAHALRWIRIIPPLLDPRWMDGVEINCHLKYKSTYWEWLTVFARQNGLIITCGGDYHADTPRSHCGTYLPDSVENMRQAVEYLQQTDEIEILKQEPKEEAGRRVVFHKHLPPSEDLARFRLRLAVKGDEEVGIRLINEARDFQRKQGFVQWTDTYPNLETICEDIALQRGYLLMENETPIGYLCIDFEGEPVYEAIDGAWNYQGAYAAIHRVGIGDEGRGKGAAHAMFIQIFLLCASRSVRAARIDTGFENRVMQHVLERDGFRRCGTVFYPPDKLRIAYEWTI